MSTVTSGPYRVSRLRAESDGVPFWGGFASVPGLIGILVGVALMARSLAQAEAATASVVWHGLRVALIPTVFGLLVLSVCLLAWYGLRSAYRRADTAGT